MHAGTRHGTRLAKSCPSTVIAARACPLCDLRLHLRPRGCPVSPSGIENNCGRPAPHAVEIQPKSTSVNELAGLRIDDVGGGAAAGYLLAGDCNGRDERCCNSKDKRYPWKQNPQLSHQS